MQSETPNRTEYGSWLTIAEKLLTTHDLQGARTFAIRARDCNSRNRRADQILAVADALIAGESRINNKLHDWYSILQIDRSTSDSELFATQYRKLALLLNPEKNKLSFADQAFKLVSDAWSVLSNPSKKAEYDSELELSRPGHRTPSKKQLPQQPPRRSPRNKDGKVVNDEQTPANLNKETESTQPSRTAESDSVESFWTACPYCYRLYEYPRVYSECTLRCQNCQRSFQAVVIPSPPVTGKDEYFCCWGFFPLGYSDINAKATGGSSGWNPISPMFPCPGNLNPNPNGSEKSRRVGRPKKTNANAPQKSAPRVYYDDQDVYVELSDSSEHPDDDDDDEWEDERKKKRAKNLKSKSQVIKNSAKKPQTERVTRQSQKTENNVGQVNVGGGENLEGGSGSSVKKQTGKGVKELGKLDLNVEFSNEVEEPVQGMSEANGTKNAEPENIEGIEFFDGLDEFLSNLPILKVVKDDDKVKST